jgi:hypothetical protein
VFDFGGAEVGRREVESVGIHYEKCKRCW